MTAIWGGYHPHETPLPERLAIGGRMGRAEAVLAGEDVALVEVPQERYRALPPAAIRLLQALDEVEPATMRASE